MTFDELRQLDPNDPGRWPLGVRVGAIAIFFVLVSVLLLWFGVWNRNKDELATLEREETTLREEFRTKNAKAVNLDLYKQQLVDIEQSFGAMLRQLPGSAEIDGLLQDISQAGNGVVRQDLFRPDAEIPKDFYAEKPIAIRVFGSYHQLAEFASAVAALSRIVTLHDVTITTPNAARREELQMDVTARTYRYLDEEELATRSAEQAATNRRRQ